jgi:hypothetical protein
MLVTIFFVTVFYAHKSRITPSYLEESVKYVIKNEWKTKAIIGKTIAKIIAIAT